MWWYGWQKNCVSIAFHYSHHLSISPHKVSWERQIINMDDCSWNRLAHLSSKALFCQMKGVAWVTPSARRTKGLQLDLCFWWKRLAARLLVYDQKKLAPEESAEEAFSSRELFLSLGHQGVSLHNCILMNRIRIWAMIWSTLASLSAMVMSKG